MARRLRPSRWFGPERKAVVFMLKAVAVEYGGEDRVDPPLRGLFRRWRPRLLKGGVMGYSSNYAYDINDMQRWLLEWGPKRRELTIGAGAAQHLSRAIGSSLHSPIRDRSYHYLDLARMTGPVLGACRRWYRDCTHFFDVAGVDVDREDATAWAPRIMELVLGTLGPLDEFPGAMAADELEESGSPSAPYMRKILGEIAGAKHASH